MYHNYPEIQVKSRTSGTLYWLSLSVIWMFMLMALYFYNYIMERHSDYTIIDYLLFWEGGAKYSNFFFVVLFLLHISVLFRILESAAMYLFGKKIRGIYLGAVIGLDKRYSPLFLLNHKRDGKSCYVGSLVGSEMPGFMYTDLGRKFWMCLDIDGNLVRLGPPYWFNVFIKTSALLGTNFFSFAFFYSNLNHMITGQETSLQLPDVSITFLEDITSFFRDCGDGLIVYFLVYFIYLVLLEIYYKNGLDGFFTKLNESNYSVFAEKIIKGKVVYVGSYLRPRKKRYNLSDDLSDDYKNIRYHYVELEIESGLPGPYYCAVHIDEDQVHFFKRSRFKFVTGKADDRGFIVLDDAKQMDVLF